MTTSRGNVRISDTGVAADGNPWLLPSSSVPLSSSWLSIHAYTTAASGSDNYDSRTDATIVETIAPLVSTLLTDGTLGAWFFVRFADPAPHIRIRMLPATKGLNRSLSGWMCEQLLLRSRESVVEVARSQPVRPYAIVRASPQEYVPESQRYGGKQGVRLAEEVFTASTEASVQMMRASPAIDRGVRLHWAVLGTLWTFHALLGSSVSVAPACLKYARASTRSGHSTDASAAEALEAVDRFVQRLPPSVHQWIRDGALRLDREEPVLRTLDAYYARVLQVAKVARTSDLPFNRLPQASTNDLPAAVIDRLAPSYVHMMNNRLGVRRQEEVLVSLLIGRALSGT